MNAYVTIPIAGSINVYLEDIDPNLSDEELFSAALDAADIEYKSGKTTEWGEVEYLERVTQGNVLYAPINEYEVEREATDEDDS